MKVERFNPDPIKRPLLQCQAQVSPGQLTYRLQDWRKKRYGEQDYEKCRHGGNFIIDGKAYCAKHAGQLALAYLLREKANAQS